MVCLSKICFESEKAYSCIFHFYETVVIVREEKLLYHPGWPTPRRHAEGAGWRWYMHPGATVTSI